MPESYTDEEERFRVNTLDVLMHLYRMYDDRERSSTLLVSALAMQLARRMNLGSEHDCTGICDSVKAELESRLRAYLDERIE